MDIIEMVLQTLRLGLLAFVVLGALCMAECMQYGRECIIDLIKE